MQHTGIQIKMTRNVFPDFPFHLKPEHKDTVLEANLIYNAVSNDHGAISGICTNGQLLGVKPGEFTFISAPQWILDIWSKHGPGRTGQ